MKKNEKNLLFERRKFASFDFDWIDCSQLRWHGTIRSISEACAILFAWISLRRCYHCINFWWCCRSWLFLGLEIFYQKFLWKLKKIHLWFRLFWSELRIFVLLCSVWPHTVLRTNHTQKQWAHWVHFSKWVHCLWKLHSNESHNRIELFVQKSHFTVAMCAKWWYKSPNQNHTLLPSFVNVSRLVDSPSESDCSDSDFCSSSVDWFTSLIFRKSVSSSLPSTFNLSSSSLIILFKSSNCCCHLRVFMSFSCNSSSVVNCANSNSNRRISYFCCSIHWQINFQFP